MPSSLFRFSITFFTIGFVFEQIERARRTSPSFRYDSWKLLTLFFISRIDCKTFGFHQKAISKAGMDALLYHKETLLP